MGLFLVLLIPTITFFVGYYRGGQLGNAKYLVNQVKTSFGLGVLRSEDTSQDAMEAESQVSAFEGFLSPIYGYPQQVKVEKVSLYGPIIEVGISEDGAMETPKAWNGVGWFINSAKPGEIGNLVLNGHYDNNWGGPAVFWVLRNVNTGDIVTVTDEYGRSYDYSTTDVFYVDIDDPNRLRILEDVDGKSTLTMITCGGVYLSGNGTYNKRLVLTAELVQ